MNEPITATDVNEPLGAMSQFVTGRALARNTGLNLLGQLLPASAALVCIPIVIRGLGIERFGVLSLVLVLLGYATIFDLGLGRATIRFAADAIGRGQPDRLPDIVWTSLSVQIALGMAGGLALAVATPMLVARLLHVPLALQTDTRNVLWLLSPAIPVLISTASLKGVLEAHQRFGIVNIVKSIAGSALFGVPALGVVAGLGLGGIMVVLDVALVATGIAYLLLALWAVPQLRTRFAFTATMLRRLFGFGGWVMVSSLTVPLLVYSDRLLLAALTSISALAYYTMPYELVSRLQVIPGSFATVLFPAFSSISASSHERLGSVYARSLRYLLMIMAPLTVGLLASAHTVLQVWVGPAFAARGASILQLIAVGVLLNSLTQVSAHLIDAVGRPDLRAKLFLAYLPGYLVLAWFLIANWGATGAALAWLLRAAFELVLFFGGAFWLVRFDRRLFVNTWFKRGGLVLAAFVAASLVLGGLQDDRLIPRLVLITTWLGLFVMVIWTWLLDNDDRSLFRALVAHGLFGPSRDVR